MKAINQIDSIGSVLYVEIKVAPNIYIKWVDQVIISNLEEFLSYERKCIDEGYEGAMFRSPSAYYKQGRSTLGVQELMRRKPFEDAEAIVMGFEEGETNTNPSIPNALGLAKRSSSKAGKIKNGTLGNYLVKGLTAFKDVEFSITAFGTEKENEERWANKEQLIGKIIKYKYQRYGSIDKPRIATGIGFRSELDLQL
jgi:DNA ligase-1